jgi:iron complex transport system substrate-binding protein
MTAHKSTLGLVLALALTPIAASNAQSPNSGDACVQVFEEGVDYFEDKAEITYAQNFSVAYRDNFKIVTVHEPFVGGVSQTYVLVKCGTPAPELLGELAGATIIQTPVRSIFSASTTHNPMFDALGIVDSVAGVASLSYATTPAILDAGAAGELIEFAATGALDVEIVIDAGPDIFMTGGSDNSLYDVLTAAGVPIVANAEWLEPSSLGRAEWLKFVSLFVDEEALATVVFDEIEASYLNAAAAIAGIEQSERPLILAGSSFQGVFYASGGRSYVAQTIEAAGGRYVFSDDTGTASIACASRYDRDSSPGPPPRPSDDLLSPNLIGMRRGARDQTTSGSAGAPHHSSQPSDDLVVFADQNLRRFDRALAKFEPQDGNIIAFVDEMRSSAVHANDTRTALSEDHIGLKPGAIGVIDHQHFLAGDDSNSVG